MSLQIIIENLRHNTPCYVYDVRVDRSNKILGNPFFMAQESQREQVCDSYRDSPKGKEYMLEIERLSGLLKKHGQLRLFCWCAPKRCHAETIRDLILGT